MTSVRWVIDTSVLISALITKGTPPDQIYQAWQDDLFRLISSRYQIDELNRVMRYEKLSRFVDASSAEKMLETIGENAEIIENLPEVTYSPDPKDNPILATAIAGKAALIVTGDKKHLLALGEVEGIPILTARDALARLNE